MLSGGLNADIFTADMRSPQKKQSVSSSSSPMVDSSYVTSTDSPFRQIAKSQTKTSSSLASSAKRGEDDFDYFGTAATSQKASATPVSSKSEKTASSASSSSAKKPSTSDVRDFYNRKEIDVKAVWEKEGTLILLVFFFGTFSIFVCVYVCLVRKIVDCRS